MKVFDLIENIETETTVVEQEIGVAKNSNQFFFQIFINSFYSNPIGSIVREVTSNCFDSHIEAKTKAPILIRKNVDKETGSITISFIDFGVGMSPERIDKIFKLFFTSTKRADNKQIGGFGIGSKTPLAYKRYSHDRINFDNSYNVITIFEGIKYTYQLYTNADCMPKISLLHSEITTEHNGTEVRIPVLSRDLNTFVKELVKQLYYFEDIVFEGFDDTYSSYEETLTNKYQIIRGKNFLYRGDKYSNYTHVCLGRVAYPINYDILEVNQYDNNIPIALKFEIGELNINASRENLDYNEHTIKAIKSKLELAKTELIEMLSKQYENVQTLEDYLELTEDFGILTFENGLTLDTKELVKQDNIDLSNFKYSFLKMPNDKELFRFFFDFSIFGKKPSRRRRYRSNNDTFFTNGGYKEIQNRIDLYYANDVLSILRLKQSYLKENHETFYIIKKRNLLEYNRRLIEDIADLFSVSLTNIYDDNKKPVHYVQSLLDMQEEYLNIVQQHTINYDNLIVPIEFIENRKKKRQNLLSTDIKNTTIPVNFIGNGTSRIKTEVLIDHKNIIFYGTKEDEFALNDARNLFALLFDKNLIVRDYNIQYKTFTYSYYRENKLKGSIMFIRLATNNLKYMKHCKKAYHISEFYNKMLYRKEDLVKNYFKYNKILAKNNELSRIYNSESFYKINPMYGVMILKINNYLNLNNNIKKIDLYKYQYLIEKYFNLNNLSMSKTEKNVINDVDELLKLQDKNIKIMRFIDLPYDINTLDNTLVKILKKIMVF